MVRLLKRLRGALGIGALGALAFHLFGWSVVGVEALLAGTWPSLDTIKRMSFFTITTGGFVGFMTASAIVLSAGSSRLVAKGRAFLVGLPIGAVGGLAVSIYAGDGLPPSALLINAITVAVATGALGVTAITIAGRGDAKRLKSPEETHELSGSV